VFGNRVLRKILERTSGQGTGGCRKLYNENPRDLYYSPNTRRAIRSIGVGWTGEGLAGILLGSLNLRDHLENLGVVGWIILRRLLKE